MAAAPKIRPGYRGFLALCRALDYPLKPFQRTIARAHFGPDREVVAILPRGSAKSTLAALLALHHILTTPDPSVYIGASSREQARVIGRILRRYARHPLIAPRVVVRTDELRDPDDPKGAALIAIVPASGEKAHGWERPTLMIGDEIWAWSDREPTLLGAMMTAMVKNTEAKFLGISTAAATMESPLGRLRARALTSGVERKGAVLTAHGGGLRWLEWSIPEHADPEDLRVVAQANPLRTIAELREQRPRVSTLEWLQFHCGRWGVQAARWLPHGAWDACHATYRVPADAPLVLGVDVGGSRSATAVVGVTQTETGVQVALVQVWQGRDAVLKASSYIAELAASGRPIREVVYDPMRFDSEAQRLERDHRLQLVEWPQSESRMTRCSENLHRLVTEQRLQHPGHPELDAHAANAIAKPTPRGWRLVKSAEGAQIDALIALAMAAERAEQQQPTFRFLGML